MKFPYGYTMCIIKGNPFHRRQDPYRSLFTIR